jgi:hypothetical protein
MGSRTCGSPESRAVDGPNVGGRLIRESVKGVAHEDMHEPAEKRRPIRESIEDPVREFHANTFTNRERSKVKVAVPKSPGLECELVADL